MNKNCETCAHNKVCGLVRIATVVDCDAYQPRCKACGHYAPAKGSSTGECPYMLYSICEDDSCTLGEFKE